MELWRRVAGAQTGTNRSMELWRRRYVEASRSGGALQV